MKLRLPNRFLAIVLSATFCATPFFATPALATPLLLDPTIGTLTLVASGSDIPRIDGLAFDSHGNLFAALETNSLATGGLVHIDTDSGAVNKLVSGIRAPDQIDFAPDGTLYLSNEISPSQTDDRLYSVSITYDGNNQPISAVAQNLSLSTGVDNPEGLIALPAESSYGLIPDGFLLVGEDLQNGRILVVNPNTGIVTELVSAAEGLGRPEGFTFGNFNDAQPNLLFAAENLADRIISIAADGSINTAVDLGAAGFSRPDNLEFGPDGKLYTGEDLIDGGRLLRIDGNGVIEVLAEGFSKPAGLVFDPSNGDGNGDLYIAEQGNNSLWRLSFAESVPTPGSALLVLFGLISVKLKRKRTH